MRYRLNATNSLARIAQDGKCLRWLACGFGVVLVLTAFAIPGCGKSEPQRVRVAGTVLLDGEPLTSGSVRFVPEIGRPSSSQISDKGHFQLTSQTVGDGTLGGVPPGKYSVAVTTAKVVDDETAIWLAPQKYANHKTSGIVVTISEPTDSLEIELFSEKEVEDSAETESDDGEAAEITEAEIEVDEAPENLASPRGEAGSSE